MRVKILPGAPLDFGSGVRALCLREATWKEGRVWALGPSGALALGVYPLAVKFAQSTCETIPHPLAVHPHRHADCLDIVQQSGAPVSLRHDVGGGGGGRRGGVVLLACWVQWKEKGRKDYASNESTPAAPSCAAGGLGAVEVEEM